MGRDLAPVSRKPLMSPQTVPPQHTPAREAAEGSPCRLGPVAGWPSVGLGGADPLAFPIARASVRETWMCQREACAHLAAAVRAAGQRGPHARPSERDAASAAPTAEPG